MKSWIKLIVVLIFALAIRSNAQSFNELSLVNIDELHFVSPLEKSVFHDFLSSGSKDYFSLFLCFDSTITQADVEKYRLKLDEQVNPFTSSYYSEMNEKKKVTKIYSAIHEAMLDKYTMLVPFSSVFKTREYHCVSSSMLYALIFNALDIPYEIRLIPNHVYLVAYPKTQFITVETTDPLHGALVFDGVFKAKFVEYLRDAKLVSGEEFNSKSTDVLFEEYFNRTDTIAIEALASIQYRNKMLEDFGKSRYKNASFMQEKAWLLYPDATNTYLLLNTWLVYYTGLNKNDLEAVKTLGKLSRFQSKGMPPEAIIGEFAQITQRQLLYDGDTELYDSSFHLLMEYITDTTLENEIAFIYNYERGRLLCNELEYRQALPYNQMAFNLKPKNSDAKNNLILTISNIVDSEGPVERMGFVNEIAGELPILLEDNLFAQLRLSTYLTMVDMSFYEKNAVQGEKYLREFEQIYPERNIKYHLLDWDIENAYGSAASYYFRTGQNGRSQAVLEKGLFYVPNSLTLKTRLNAVK